MPDTHRNPLLRRLEILKLLQGRSMRTAEIAAHFRDKDSEVGDDETRTIRRDLEALRDGINVLGTTVKITENRKGHSQLSYKSTVHPFFLALNLTELFALLKLLEDASSDPDPHISKTYRHLFKSIYSQLTDYAKEIIQPKLKHEHESIAVSNRLDENYYKDNILYLWKSGTIVEITYSSVDGKRITSQCRVEGYKNGEVAFADAETGERITRTLDEILIDWGTIKYR
ncbi:MAG: hypothetical protein ACOX8A_12160 [Thermacetogeniaceae bacterium]|jgi:predicted DNA-binding transcriptional regulator YafY